jgi:hypothetical protein
LVVSEARLSVLFPEASKNRVDVFFEDYIGWPALRFSVNTPNIFARNFLYDARSRVGAAIIHEDNMQIKFPVAEDGGKPLVCR